MPTAHHLVELEREALRLKNSGRIAEAARLFAVIVEEQPDWEHGNGLLNLAQCYEDLGQLELAEKFYRTALDYEPTSELVLGGYASFLYLHGKAEDAFDAYVTLLGNYKRQNRNDNIDSCIVALNTLGERLGWSRDIISEKIANSTV